MIKFDFPDRDKDPYVVIQDFFKQLYEDHYTYYITIKTSSTNGIYDSGYIGIDRIKDIEEG